MYLILESSNVIQFCNTIPTLQQVQDWKSMTWIFSIH